MKMLKYTLCLFLVASMFACTEESDPLLKDDYLMKTYGPAIAGEPMEFAYAMGAMDGMLASATAEVNIAGAAGTGFDPNSYHVDTRGNDVGVEVADVTTEGTLTTATFTADTAVSTLRYTYVVPEEAKGQEITITFSAESTTGHTVSTTVPAFTVSNMTMKREIVLSDQDVCYFSIENLRGYTEAEVIANGLEDKIDLIYIYDALNPEGFLYGHALVSPGADERYFNEVNVPASFRINNTLIEKQAYLWDSHFTGEVPSVYVDDIDLETYDLTGAADFVIGITTKNSAFMETADGRYHAYIYINEARGGNLTFGMKRLEIQ
jgi:hypothetical protein